MLRVLTMGFALIVATATALVFEHYMSKASAAFDRAHINGGLDG